MSNEVQMLSFGTDQEVVIEDRGMKKKDKAALKGEGNSAQGYGVAGRNDSGAIKREKRRLEQSELESSQFYLGKGLSDKEIDRVRNPKMRGKLRENEQVAKDTALSTHRAMGVLLPGATGGLQAEGLAQTYHFRQRDIVAAASAGAKKKFFELKLEDYGPYSVDYTRNGRFLLLGGRRGHISLMDWHKFESKCEIHVKETVRDVQMLHNESMFAVAQKKYVHLYDETGTEVHVLRHQLEVTRLGYLPYHYLLTSASKLGTLRYQDVSTGQIVAEHRSRLGPCDVLTHNPSNAIVHLGHSDGQVTLWSPTMTEALVKVQCHNGPVRACAIDAAGRTMVTSGGDGRVKVWDLRMYKSTHGYFTPRPAESIDISQTGLMALSFGPHVQVWRDALAVKAQSPYLYEMWGGDSVREVRFCPLEDVLGVGREKGFTNMLVPGAGEANFDTFVANPFETRRQREESTVKSLLEKLQPSMISLDTRAFNVMSREDEAAHNKAEMERKKEAGRIVVREAEKDKRRTSSVKRTLRRRANIIEQKKQDLKEAIVANQEKARVAREEEKAAIAGGTYVPSALDRFKKK